MFILAIVLLQLAAAAALFVAFAVLERQPPRITVAAGRGSSRIRQARCRASKR